MLFLIIFLSLLIHLYFYMFMFSFTLSYKAIEAWKDCMRRKVSYLTMKQQTYFQAAKAQTLDLELESFEASDFLSFSENESGETERSNHLNSHHHIKPSQIASSRSIKSAVEEASSKGKKRKRKCEREERYTFKTRSESDVMDDGYKWRKYGRKTVKNSPNPRNYYKCADHNQCCVKKRVQRDADDKGVVITTYEGKHNHQRPSVVYFIQKPFVVFPHHASLDQSPPLFYTSSSQPEFTFMNTT